MKSRILSPLAVVALLTLAGCSDDAPAKAEPSSSITSTDVPLPPMMGRLILPPSEVFNQTFEFPRASDDPPFEATFDVDADQQGLQFVMTATADCPVYMGSGSPQVEFTPPSGDVIVLKRFGGNSGTTFSGACSLQDGTTPRELDPDSTKTTSPAAGTWGVASHGEFTGSVRVVVTANPA